MVIFSFLASSRVISRIMYRIPVIIRGLVLPEGWFYQRDGSTRGLVLPERWFYQRDGSTREMVPPERWFHQRDGSTREMVPPERFTLLKVGMGTYQIVRRRCFRRERRPLRSQSR